MSACRTRWGRGGQFFRCRCQTTPSGALCRTCAFSGRHHLPPHRLFAEVSTNGGFCDCGDGKTFPTASCCVQHGGTKLAGCCGTRWGPGQSFFRCLTCAKAPTAALCTICARSPSHSGHRLEVEVSTYGGSCDCGDLRFFPSNTCEAHSDDEPAFRQVESGMASLSVRSPSPTPSAVEPISKPKIFFSYSWNDADCVRPLAARCEAFADVWIDVKNLQGAHWLYHKIVQAIDDTDVMVVCISESYLKSDNCEKEILLAGDWKKKILPLKLPDLQRWPPRHGMAVHLAGKLYVDLAKDTADNHVDQIKKIAEDAGASKSDTVLL